VGNVGNLFPTNYFKPYIGNSVLMGIFDILYTFVGMWECGSIKKYIKNLYIFCKILFEENFPHFHNHISVKNIQTSLSVTTDSKNKYHFTLSCSVVFFTVVFTNNYIQIRIGILVCRSGKLYSRFKIPMHGNPYVIRLRDVITY